MQLGELSKGEMYQSCIDYCHTQKCVDSDNLRLCAIQRFCRGLKSRHAEENEPEITDIERAYEIINKKR